MQYRPLGKTGLSISAISFGAGPISQLLVGHDADRQRAVIQHAIDRGINWFDTAATYGNGQSEQNLGRVLNELNAVHRVHIATKVRLTPEDLADIPGAIRRSVTASLERLRLPRVTLLQLHNSITKERGDEPSSITPQDVLGPAGVAKTFERLRFEGVALHLGLTGLGQPAALREVVASGRFETMQVPYQLLNPTAGWEFRGREREANYGNIISDCALQGMGVLAIRVFAGGALLGNPPSPHTLKTPFFPLALYQRDGRRAELLKSILGPELPLAQAAVRFALAHPFVHSALTGFCRIGEIDEALQALDAGPSRIFWDDVLAALDAQAH
ncbi:MAG TPA: aldo/keto reductase [Pirellulaceae bacterium]|nr:aldo/keto reductase [Pirellulaceae bacterium]